VITNDLMDLAGRLDGLAATNRFGAFRDELKELADRARKEAGPHPLQPYWDKAEAMRAAPEAYWDAAKKNDGTKAPRTALSCIDDVAVFDWKDWQGVALYLAEQSAERYEFFGDTGLKRHDPAEVDLFGDNIVVVPVNCRCPHSREDILIAALIHQQDELDAMDEEEENEEAGEAA
jgi:hypothetical protein